MPERPGIALGELAGPAVMLGLVLLVFGDVLRSGGERILSAPGTDLQTQFIPWRQFATTQMRAGNIPLWNPHAFCGAPFVGNLQSAVFYPPHLAMLAMSPGQWANWTIALHVLLAGVLMYVWARYRSIGRVGATISGAAYMFCAPYALHILPGHVSFICTAAWTPLIFLCADAILDRPAIGWGLLGAFAVAMQILAGYPQPAYIAAVAATIYLALNLRRAQSPKRIVVIWIGMYLAGALLAGIQLGPAIAANRASGRAGRIPVAMASAGSMPPANLITLLVPGFWGDEVRFRYFGQEFNWEDLPYLGTIPLLLALFAEGRRRRFGWSVAVVMGVIALGSHTPLFGLLYRALPAFGQFRVPGRYFCGAAPLVALMAGMGFDRLKDNPSAAKRSSIVYFALAVAMVGGGAWLMRTSADGLAGTWGKMLDAFVSRPGVVTQISPAFFRSEEFVRESARFAARESFVAAAFVAGLGALVIASTRRRQLILFVAPLALWEMTAFMLATHATCPVQPALPQSWANVLASDSVTSGADRVLCSELAYCNSGMIFGFDNVLGYDPIGVRRFAQFFAWTQGQQRIDDVFDPGAFQQFPSIPLLRMLRCRFILESVRQPAVAELSETLGHVRLISKCEVAASQADALARVSASGFDPTEWVVLEQQPHTLPQGNAGSVRVIRESTDAMEIQADVAQASLLLVTDAYSSGWSVRSLDQSKQTSYEILPADAVLRAIPLVAGNHHFVLEYRPAEWVIGKWLTVFSAAAWAGAAATLFRRWTRCAANRQEDEPHRRAA